MAASVKEKNMPTISANLYGGLQKWVHRASTSIRERKRNRRNSDVSQSLHRESPTDNQGFQAYGQSRIVPVHVRSRSTPVEMSEDYLNLEQSYKTTTEESKTDKSKKEGLLEPWRRHEFKDDTSQREKTTTVEGRNLIRSHSKSESSLIEATRNSEKLRTKSETIPPKSQVRRTNSQGNEDSIESSTADLDINYNINKKSRSSPTSSKANIRDRPQTLEHTVNSNGAVKVNKTLRKSSSHDKIARDIKTRLDRWVDKTAGFQDARQSSFESTSSSDEMGDILSFQKENNPAISKETREMRELQIALEELVSGCGRGSRKTSEEDQTGESMEATNTRASRKVSLKNAGTMFSKALDTDNHCSQSVRQNEYRLKKCGSSSGSTVSGGSIVDEVIQQQETFETNSELEESYDSVDGKALETENLRNSEKEESRDTNSSLNCDEDIGRDSHNTRVLSTSPESLEWENSDKKKRIPSSSSEYQDDDDDDDENQQSKHNDEDDNSSSLNDTKRTNERYVGKKEENENASQTKLASKSTKTYRAPVPPSERKKSKDRKGKKTSDVKFDDLNAFAEECLRQADRKERKTKDRRSKSDSEEEKKSLKVDFIYIKNEAQEASLAHSYPGRVEKNSSIHPNAAFDERIPEYTSLSDNELERSESPSIPTRIFEKRNSADSLDGRILCDLLPQDSNTDFKHVQNIEDYHSSDGLQTDEDLAAENTGMRKFPSMPLFYIPKDFDHRGEFKNSKSSLRKSLWKRIKGLPRQSENHRGNQNIKSKRKEDGSSTPQLVDPFYHGEKEEDDLDEPVVRAKAWTLGTTKISRPVSQGRRPTLETRLSAPLMKVEKAEQEPRNRKLNEHTVIPALNDESQC